jgi:pSer/pThr/pTyr-binding forkhead associated (FHA) protein
MALTLFSLFLLLRKKTLRYVKLKKIKKRRLNMQAHAKFIGFVEKKPYLQTIKSNESSTFSIDKNSMFIGRADDCHICIEDETVSYRHAHIEKDNEIIRISDENSTNGLFVNGQRVKNAQLKQHDIIRIGNTFLTLNN